MSATASRAGTTPSRLVGDCFGTFRLPDDLRFVVTEGQGPWITDNEGRRRLDMVMGSGAVVLGHSHPDVVDALLARVPLGQTFYALNEPALELVELIGEMVPSAESVKLVGSGADATFAALRLARAFTGREQIVKFEGAYHGHHDYSLQSVAPKEPSTWPLPQPDSSGIPSAFRDLVRIVPYNDLEVIRELFIARGDEIAAVIVEPVQRAIPPVPGFLQGLRDLCDNYGAVLIFDEVVTGFRLAPGGGQELYGVVPDLTTLAKSIGGGLPMGAIAGRQQLLEHTVPGSVRHSYLSGTLNGNPISSIAGVATLNVIKQGEAIPAMKRAAGMVRSGLQELFEKHGVPGMVIGEDPVIEVVFSDEPITDFASYGRRDARLGSAYAIELLRRDVFANPGSKTYLSSAHDEDAIDSYLAAAREALPAALGQTI